MATKAKSPIPEGFRTATPYLVIRDAAKAIEFYKKAFGAQVRFTMPTPDGKVAHGEIQIGDSIIMIADENPDWGVISPQTLNGSASSVFLYVPDVDATFKQAIAAGATEAMPVADMFWGDRYGKVVDPFGHRWDLATHVEDVTPAEMEERGKKFMAAASGAA